LGRTEPFPSFGGVVPRWRPSGGRLVELRPSSSASRATFQEVLEARRSRRNMVPPSLGRIAELLWHGARVRETGTGRFGLAWEHRASASGGGLHPLGVVVAIPGWDELYFYDSLRHELMECVGTRDALLALRNRAREVLPECADSAILTLFADRGYAASGYEFSESLIWRDAGCLLATLHMCAEWLGLEFCPLGILGHEVVDALSGDERLVAAGACVCGERARGEAQR
jgi:hypothetical protein